MITRMRGQLSSVNESRVELEISGIFFDVMCPQSTLKAMPGLLKTVELWVCLLWRDEVLQIFGFASAAEKLLFEQLLRVSGVGPRLALATLSHLPIEAVVQAIVQDQKTVLAAVPGIGLKTAARVVLELKDRMPVDLLYHTTGQQNVSQSQHSELQAATTALVGLGFSWRQAQDKLAKIDQIHDLSLAEILRQALRQPH